jgi:josephin
MSYLYHERQRLALCGVHAVNNLLQSQRYAKRDFDDVCLTLSPSVVYNPHRSMLRIGDYDVNVVMILLQQEGYSVSWHDRRTALESETIENLIGVLWNVDSTSIWGRIFRSRHWIALYCKDSDQWINLDSDLPDPVAVGTHDECIRLLNSKPNAHILLVMRMKQ